MTALDDEMAARAARAREWALFRYALVRPAADPQLSPRERGLLVRQLAEQQHRDPHGRLVRVGRSTLDRWVKALMGGGFAALVPKSRALGPRTDAQLLELAAGLKRERPTRSAAQVRRILQRHTGAAPSTRTIQRHFVRLELNTRPDGRAPATFGRFEAAAVGQLWTADFYHGPKIDGRKTYLFAIIDDHSRYVVGHRWRSQENTIGLLGALRDAVAAHGAPKVFYVDNGSPLKSTQLLHALAVLGVRITHSRPRRPQGRGKVERAFRTVGDQFVVELSTPGDPAGTGTRVATVSDLDRLFTAWLHRVYHRGEHSETGQPPAERFHAAEPELTRPDPQTLREAFLWQDFRTVSKTAVVSLYGNKYTVDPALAGRKVELLYDPFDLSDIEVRWRGRPMGKAVPQVIGRHSHPDVPEATPAPVTATGIDYLRLVEADYHQDLAAGINYAALTDQPQPDDPEQQPDDPEQTRRPGS
jgi:putative transposase